MEKGMEVCALTRKETCEDIKQENSMLGSKRD